MSGEDRDRQRGASLPVEVLDHLVAAGIGRHAPTWICLDEDDRVSSWGGAPGDHGLDELVEGGRVPASAAWLHGILPAPTSPLFLPELSTGSRRADVHVWRTDSGTWILLLDSTTRVAERERALERANQASYLRERLEGEQRRSHGARVERAEAFTALGAEILERGPDGRYRPQEGDEHAPWLDQVCEWEPGGEKALSSDDPTSFLGAFLAEASEELDDFVPSPARVRHVIRSGMWTQMVDGEEAPFEAFAMALSTGRRLLIVEHLDLRYRERQELLQRARETSLSFEALRREVQTKDVLLHCIVHDLRSPLASISGALALLGGDKLDEERRAQMIEIALRQTRRQEELIGAVLEVFQAEVEDLDRFEEDASRAPDLRIVAREQVERSRPAFQSSGVTLLGPDPGAPIAVAGRTDRLERVVANLVDNALRHAPSGSTVEVRVAPAGPESPAAALVVADRGPGVPEALKGALFDRFVRGTAGGAAGLGLFYCRMTVERWGGSIEYRDREGGGAEFVVRLRPAGALSSSPPPGA